MIKLITFDFDGTTADTMPFLEKIAIKLLTQFYKLPTEEARLKYRSTTGLPFEQQVTQLFPQHSMNTRVIELFEHQKIEEIFSLPLFPDTKEVINHLKRRGYLIAISSSTFQSTIEEYCKRKGLEVDQILGYRKGFEKGRDHFEFLQKKFNVSADEMVYIGDSLMDCKRAESNDILFIGKTGMFKKQQFNEISSSNLTIDSLSELKTLLPKLQPNGKK
ncbi:HAD family hydrolase [Candidatus Heimdallarchaeota archaeon]|nr:MAG: HAD family hydrolase [Candidatus Heimdallarchaeota archaeon]